MEDKYDDYRLLPPFSKSAKNVDWRDWGVVAPVRSQGSCGSCWAFDVIATVESWHAIVNGPLIHLSEQHLVDCDNSNGGCNGGWPTDAYKFMGSNGYIRNEDYLYVGYEQSCLASSKSKVAYLGSTSYIDWWSGSYDDFKAAIRLGPLSIAFGASNEFMGYSSGVYDGSCSGGVNHAMVAIGYGVDSYSGLEYALIRNSWGSGWGDGGNVKIKISPNDAAGGLCLLYQYPSYPVPS